MAERGVRVEEVQDESDDEGQRAATQPEAIFVNPGAPMTEQDLGDGNPIIYHVLNAQEAPPRAGEHGNGPIFHYQAPNLQALEPVPPHQLRAEGYQAIPQAAGGNVPGEKHQRKDEEDSGEEKGEKEKNSGNSKERQRWEEKEQRMREQLQRQRWLSKQQRLQSGEKKNSERRARSWTRQYSEEEDEQQESCIPSDRRPVTMSAGGQSQPPSQAWTGPQAQNWTNLQGRPTSHNMWNGPGPWQQPQEQGGRIWKQPEEQETTNKKAAGKKKPRYVISEDSEDLSEDSDEMEEKKRKKKEKEKSWEKETAKQRKMRYRKYERMSQTTDSEKQSVKHQVSAMYKSVIAQEKVIKHLRSLFYHGSTEEQIQENRDLLEEVIAARRELVERISYLEVAYDYDWEAAKVF